MQTHYSYHSNMTHTLCKDFLSILLHMYKTTNYIASFLHLFVYIIYENLSQRPYTHIHMHACAHTPHTHTHTHTRTHTHTHISTHTTQTVHQIISSDL